MKMRCVSLFLLWGVSGVVLPAPAEPASVERLFREMQLDAQFEDMRGQVGAFLKAQNDATLAQHPELASDPEMRELVEGMLRSISEAAFDEMTGADARAEMVGVYVRVFTEEEVQGLIAFYTSPAGRAFTAKMPAVTREVMAMSQQRMQVLAPRLQRDLERFQSEVRRIVEERKARR